MTVYILQIKSSKYELIVCHSMPCTDIYFLYRNPSVIAMDIISEHYTDDIS